MRTNSFTFQNGKLPSANYNEYDFDVVDCIMPSGGPSFITAVRYFPIQQQRARTPTSNKFLRFNFDPAARGHGEFTGPLSASTANRLKSPLNSIINRSNESVPWAAPRHLSKYSHHSFATFDCQGKQTTE